MKVNKERIGIFITTAMQYWRIELFRGKIDGLCAVPVLHMQL